MGLLQCLGARRAVLGLQLGRFWRIWMGSGDEKTSEREMVGGGDIPRVSLSAPGHLRVCLPALPILSGCRISPSPAAGRTPAALAAGSREGLATRLPVHIGLADLLTSLGGGATLCPFSFSFCSTMVSVFSPNTLDLPRKSNDISKRRGLVSRGLPSGTGREGSMPGSAPPPPRVLTALRSGRSRLCRSAPRPGSGRCRWLHRRGSAGSGLHLGEQTGP